MSQLRMSASPAAMARLAKDDLQVLMQDPRFQRWMLRFLSKCSILHDGYTGSDIAATAHLAGRRGVGLEVLADIMRLDAGAVHLIFPSDAALANVLGMMPDRQEQQDQPPQEEA